ncbi:unnamed protein product [Adineta ricciae]|uniref:Carrier domain-containing protein n=1 Tax=Adineta ricciae TaxID=249248 RepID=A0A813SUB9_ADIRI|nr:unnamed protein product [Adineta ricciae]
MSSISSCIVIKWNNDHLVAYVQTDNDDVEYFREHCRSHLPSLMVPSIFIVVKQFPLSTNGKIDRKRLPQPDSSLLTNLSTSLNEMKRPENDFEECIHNIWSKILRYDGRKISTKANFFTIGGHSLLFIELYNIYQLTFDFDSHIISISSFLQQPTIIDHCQLLRSITNNKIQSNKWHSLHINQGIASFAQERIYVDENIRFSNKIAIYNELTALRIIEGSISLDRLSKALRYVLSKHKILRTALKFCNDNSILKQYITDKHEVFEPITDGIYNDEKELQDIIHRTVTNPCLFNLSTGHVFCCQILRQKTIFDNEKQDSKFIKNSDILILGFHHIATDRTSHQIFLRDLCFAYNTDVAWVEDEEALQYIDYSSHERLINFKPSCDFWRLEFKEYNFDHRLSLPFDQHRLLNDKRSGFGSSAEISFNRETSASFLNHAITHKITPFQLGLAVFYIFLFKLSNDEADLSIACLNVNRYKTELQNMMGMFITTLPYRLQFSTDWSFSKFVEQVKKKCLSIFEHSHYPLQNIINDFHLSQSGIPFFQTAFDFITTTSTTNQFSFDNVTLKSSISEKLVQIAKFDFMVTFVYNSILDDNTLSCKFICSNDLFRNATVAKFAERFEHLFEQIFHTDSSVNRDDLLASYITQFSLVLPEEINEIEDIVFCRQLDIINEAPASYAQSRIWLDEQIRFDSKTSQVAIYNMPFLHRISSNGFLLASRLHQAIQLVIRKHQALRTALYFDTEKNTLIQHVKELNNINHDELFTFVESTFETNEDLLKIMHNERGNPNYFNLSKGIVCRCHIVYYKEICRNGMISDKDAIIFNFHHALFDFPSMNIFHRDLDQAYTNGHLENDQSTTLRYIDFSIVEQRMPMVAASNFWLDTLRNFIIDRPLSLPFDRHRLPDEHRTGRGISVSFRFEKDLSGAFITYASVNNIQLEHLALASYFIFLFKLTNSEDDICIVMNHHGRCKPELMSIIGMFVNAIPMRCKINSQHSIQEFANYLKERVTQTIEYSYFPLQRILAQHPLNVRPAFLDTFFQFSSISNEISDTKVSINDISIITMPYSIQIDDAEIASKFDFSLNILYNPVTNQLSCTLDASTDLFNELTIIKMSQQFHGLLQQLLTSNTNDQCHQSICETSLLLSDDRMLIQSMNNTQTSYSCSTCIYHEFVCRVMAHPQKLSVELDDQCLTPVGANHFMGSDFSIPVDLGPGETAPAH